MPLPKSKGLSFEFTYNPFAMTNLQRPKTCKSLHRKGFLAGPPGGGPEHIHVVASEHDCIRNAALLETGEIDVRTAEPTQFSGVGEALADSLCLLVG